MRFNLVDRSSVDLGQIPIAEDGRGHASPSFDILDKRVESQKAVVRRGLVFGSVIDRISQRDAMKVDNFDLVRVFPRSSNLRSFLYITRSSQDEEPRIPIMLFAAVSEIEMSSFDLRIIRGDYIEPD